MSNTPREDVIKLAREAGVTTALINWVSTQVALPKLEGVSRRSRLVLVVVAKDVTPPQQCGAQESDLLRVKYAYRCDAGYLEAVGAAAPDPEWSITYDWLTSSGVKKYPHGSIVAWAPIPPFQIEMEFPSRHDAMAFHGHELNAAKGNP